MDILLKVEINLSYYVEVALYYSFIGGCNRIIKVGKDL